MPRLQLTSTQQKVIKLLAEYSGDESGFIPWPRNMRESTAQALEKKGLLEISEGGRYLKVRLSDEAKQIADKLKGKLTR